MIRKGFVFGLVAASASGLAMFVARAFLGAPTVPEVLMDLATVLTPLPLFSFLLETFGHWTKALSVAFLSLLTLLVGGGMGILWLWGDARLFHRGQEQREVRPASWRCWGYSLAFAAALWLFAMLVVLPVAKKGPFGSRSGPDVALYWLAYAAVYGGGLAGLTYRRLPWDRPVVEELPSRKARRRLVRNLGLVIAGAAVAGAVGRYVWAAINAPARRRAAMPPEVTPNDVFYTVSKNMTDPRVSSDGWKLTVEGQVERPITLSYDDLKRRPSVTQYYTLMCISNGIGGDLMGNALWKGVPLRDLLLEAGVKDPESIRKVALFAADEYYDSIPLDKAMDPATLIAYEMNGVPLPDSHGFPARLLVPGIYGMKNVKWLTSIKLLDRYFIGFWQEREWSDEAIYQTMSRIDVPINEDTYLKDEIGLAGGVAFAGDRGIQRVEVSFDSGDTWVDAEVKEARSPYSWVLWTKEWVPPGPGDYTIKVRATDGTGQLQEPTISGPLPWGITGIHSVNVRIRDYGARGFIEHGQR